MYRHTHTPQRREQRLEAVGQTQRTRRQRQQRAEKDQQNKAQSNVCAAHNPLPRRCEESDPERLRARRHKKMHSEGEEHDPENRTDRAQLHHERNPREHHEKCDSACERGKAGRILDKEDQQQKEKEQDNLHARIHAVQERISRQIASDLYIVKQNQSLPIL